MVWRGGQIVPTVDHVTIWGKTPGHWELSLTDCTSVSCTPLATALPCQLQTPTGSHAHTPTHRKSANTTILTRQNRPAQSTAAEQAHASAACPELCLGHREIKGARATLVVDPFRKPLLPSRNSKSSEPVRGKPNVLLLGFAYRERKPLTGAEKPSAKHPTIGVCRL